MAIVKSQTEAPRGRITRDPDRHYIKVERDDPHFAYDSPLHEFLDMSSIENPDEPMYRIDSESARDTGSSQMILMSCSKADNKLFIENLDRIARRNEGAVVTDSDDKSEGYEEITRKRSAISS